MNRIKGWIRGRSRLVEHATSEAAAGGPCCRRLESLADVLMSPAVRAAVPKGLPSEPARLSAADLRRLFEDAVPGSRKVRYRDQPKTFALDFIVSAYASGLKAYAQTELHDYLTSLLRIIIHRAEDGCARRYLAQLVEAFTNCQAVQARAIERIGLELVGVATGLEGLLVELADSYKGLAVKAFALQDLPKHTDSVHFENRCIADLGFMLGLRPSDVARARADAHILQVSGYSGQAIPAAVWRVKELFDAEAMLTAFVSEVNSFSDKSPQQSLARAFVEWIGAHCRQRHIVFDEDCMRISINTSFAAAVFDVVFFGRFQGDVAEVFRAEPLSLLLSAKRLTCPEQLGPSADASTSSSLTSSSPAATLPSTSFRSGTSDRFVGVAEVLRIDVSDSDDDVAIAAASGTHRRGASGSVMPEVPDDDDVVAIGEVAGSGRSASTVGAMPFASDWNDDVVIGEAAGSRRGASAVGVMPTPARKRARHRTVEARSGTSVRVPCELCGLAVPFESYDLHVVAHAEEPQQETLRRAQPVASVVRVPCELCGLAVPFESYASHLASHAEEQQEAALRKAQQHCVAANSPVGVAVRLLEAVRGCNVVARAMQPTNVATNITTKMERLNHVVNFDLAVAFVKHMHQLLWTRGLALARPVIVYHWTPACNFERIEDTNLQAPSENNNVKKQTSDGAYGRGVYTAPRFRCKANLMGNFGAGASACFLCLGLPGRQYPAWFPSWGRELEDKWGGFDSHVSADDKGGANDGPGDELVFFQSDQLLPCFLVGDQDHERAASVVAGIVDMLMDTVLDLASTSCAM